MRFYPDYAGRWSGGGNAVADMFRYAAERHPVLQGSPGSDDVPMYLRNVLPSGARGARTFVWSPQNALPYTRYAVGLTEWRLLLQLRAGTEFYARRASAIMRLSSAMPTHGFTGIRCSPVMHNVLDPGFEQAVAAAASETVPEAADRIVSIGSASSYRNLDSLLAGYGRYRERGGTRGLFIAGRAGSAEVRDALVAQAAALPDVTVRWGSLPRPQVLAAMRDAAAVVMPSLVECSPVTLLEAGAMSPRLAVSGILSHRELLATVGEGLVDEPALFAPRAVAAVADAIEAAERGSAEALHRDLADPDVRDSARERWSARLSEWLVQLADDLERSR